MNEEQIGVDIGDDLLEPGSRFRDEVLERHLGGPKYDIIKKIAQRWAKTREWRFRVELATTAYNVKSGAEAIYEPNDERCPWLTAECAVDLADSCRAYLKLYDSLQ